MIDYRLLLPDEYELARPLLGDALPRPDVSAIAGAFDGNTLVGCLVLQLQWHLEPLVLANPSVNYRRLKDVLDNGLHSAGGGTYYAFTNSEHVMDMALRCGMEVEPMMILKGVVEARDREKVS